jgi:hypothetical protein
MEEIKEVKKSVEDLKEKSFAMELLQDAKKTNKRMFIIIIVILTMWFSSIGFFIYYIKTTAYEVVTETAEVENEDGNANACVGDNCNNGVINGESKSDKDH